MSIRIFRQVLLTMLALLGLVAGEAFAQSTTSTVTVSAVVPKACRFYTATANMSIGHGGGDIDPTSGSNATGSVNLTYRCSNGDSPQFDIDTSGAYASPKTRTVTLTFGANNLNADITVTGGGAGTGLGAGNDKTAAVSGLITPANFGGAVPGTYSKDVTVAIQAIP